ncbi:hypothetical protein BGZ52_007008, partial [Haplosporangium bisporale]
VPALHALSAPSRRSTTKATISTSPSTPRTRPPRLASSPSASMMPSWISSTVTRRAPRAGPSLS